RLKKGGWEVVAFSAKATSPMPRSHAAWVSAAALAVLCHPDSHFLPSFGVFFSMSAYQVTVAFDLRPALFDESSFDVSPSQIDRDQMAIHRFVAPEAKVFNPRPRLRVEVDNIARPSTAVSLQDGLWLAAQARTGKVRRRVLLRRTV